MQKALICGVLSFANFDIIQFFNSNLIVKMSQNGNKNNCKKTRHFKAG